MMRLSLLVMMMLTPRTPTAAGAATTSLFVDPGRGDDANDGASASSPLRTLQAARDAARHQLAEPGACGVRVQLAPGESKTVRFAVSVRTLSTVDKHGTRHTLAGEHGTR
jgi:hypothetical protein